MIATVLPSSRCRDRRRRRSKASAFVFCLLGRDQREQASCSPTQAPTCGFQATGARLVGVVLERVLAAAHRHHAGADHLDDPERPQQVGEVLDLLLFAGDLDDHRLLRDVDDARAEDVRQLVHLAAVLARDRHLDQRQVAVERRLLRHVLDLDHVDQLVEVLLQALDLFLRCRRDQRHARQVVVVGAPDGQAVDVEVAAPEQVGHPRQDAGPVLDQRGEDVAVRCASWDRAARTVKAAAASITPSPASPRAGGSSR